VVSLLPESLIFCVSSLPCRPYYGVLAYLRLPILTHTPTTNSHILHNFFPSSSRKGGFAG